MKRTGFSLIELAVVMGIIILLLAIILPTIGPALKRSRMREGAAVVSAAATEARSRAIANSCYSALDFVSVDHPGEESKYLWVVSRDKYVAAPGNPSGLQVDAVDGSRYLEARTKVAALDKVQYQHLSAPVVQFYPDGSSSGGVVTLKDRSSAATVTISISVARGKPSISKTTD